MIAKISSANSPMSKIGLQTNKISFGKWWGEDDKFSSSSSSSRARELSDYEDTLRRRLGPTIDTYENPKKSKQKDKKVEKKEKTTKKQKTSADKPATQVTKSQLIDKLRQYADDPVMVKIIAQQLENLG